ELVPDEVVMVPPRQVEAVPLLDRRARIVAWIAAAIVLALVAAAAIAFLALRGSCSVRAAATCGSTSGPDRPPARCSSRARSRRAGTCALPADGCGCGS